MTYNIVDNVDGLLNKIEVDNLLEYLTPKEREMIILWIYGDYTLATIAKILKKRYNESPKFNGRVVCARIHAILKRLRSKLKIKIASNPKRK